LLTERRNPQNGYARDSELPKPLDFGICFFPWQPPLEGHDVIAKLLSDFANWANQPSPGRAGQRPTSLVVFAGSGISMLAPSYLPDWKGFYESLLGEIKEAALRLPGIDGQSQAAIQSLSLERFTVAAFSDAIVDGFAGERYFPALKILDSDRTNANHEALAALAGRGIVQAIVTTNFDTLIERALAAAGIAFDAYVTPSDYERIPLLPGRLPVYKIHGSVGAAATPIDTVTQKLKGLGPHVRQRLAALFREFRVLVVGFSGEDLRFGDDYLAMSAIDDKSPGITWLVRRKDPPNAKAKEIVDRAGPRGEFVFGDLPDFFTTLGVTPAKVAPVDDEKKAANGRTESRVREWLDGLHAGPLEASLFCASLLRSIGQQSGASALAAVFAGLLQKAGDVNNPTVALVRAQLSALANESSDLEGASQWAQGTLQCWQAIERDNEPNGGLPPDLRLARDAQCASAWAQLGLGYLNQKLFDQSLDALQRETACAQASGSPRLLGAAYANRAYLADKAGIDSDRRLPLIHAAEALAREANSVQAIAEAAHFEALTLTGRCEYNAALRAIERGRRYADLGVGSRARTALDFAAADIECRRGRPDKAYQILTRAIEGIEDNAVFAAQVRVNMCRMLAFDRAVRPALAGQLDQVLAQMEAGHVPRDLGMPGVYSQEAVKQFRDDLATNRLPERPGFLRDPQVGDDEAQTRARIAAAEYAGRSEELPLLFRDLCRIKAQQMRPWANLELAAELIALSGGDETLRAEGWSHAGMAHLLLGDWKRAAEKFQAASGGNAWAARNLARLQAAMAPSTPPNPPLPARLLSFDDGNPITLEHLKALREYAESAGELRDLGLRAVAAGLIEEAMDVLLDAQTMDVETRNTRGVARGLAAIAEVLHRRGRWDNAAQLLQQGLEIANLLDNTEGMIEAQAMLAFCYRRTGEPDKAFAAVGQAMELAGNSAPTRYTLLAASVFAEMFGQFPDGRSAMQQFVAEYPQVRDRAGFEAIYESFQQQRRA